MQVAGCLTFVRAHRAVRTGIRPGHRCRTEFDREDLLYYYGRTQPTMIDRTHAQAAFVRRGFSMNDAIVEQNYGIWYGLDKRKLVEN